MRIASVRPRRMKKKEILSPYNKSIQKQEYIRLPCNAYNTQPNISKTRNCFIKWRGRIGKRWSGIEPDRKKKTN